MTPCDRPREALLEAEPDVLAGIGASELAVHVRECETCRSAGQAIRNATARLDAELGSAGSRPDIEAILGRARAAPRRRAPSRPWLVAAAAAIAALMVLGRREPAPQVTMRPPAAAAPLVEAADGADVAVIPTTDPDITIVWFFQGG